jgi:hypothetical protein
MEGRRAARELESSQQEMRRGELQTRVRGMRRGELQTRVRRMRRGELKSSVRATSMGSKRSRREGLREELLSDIMLARGCPPVKKLYS